jgi:hypothetical protein
MLKPAATTLVLGLLASAPALAQPDAFWCGSRLIREGMPSAEITQRCGKPDSVEVIEQPIMASSPGGGRHQVGIKKIEIWTYDRGSRRFPARITIDEGIATEVALVRN